MLSVTFLKQLFLRKAQEIQQRIRATPNYYNYMMAAGLIRHLFFDDPSLVEKVRSEYGIPIRFEILVSTPDASMAWFGPSMRFYVLRLDPEGAGDMFKREFVSFDELIAQPFVKVQEHCFTVKEILDFCAYVRGGVHDDEPSLKEAMLYDDDSPMFSADPDLMAAIHEIVIIILRGLAPLANAIYSELLKMQEQRTAATSVAQPSD